MFQYLRELKITSPIVSFSVSLILLDSVQMNVLSKAMIQIFFCQLEKKPTVLNKADLCHLVQLCDETDDIHVISF